MLFQTIVYGSPVHEMLAGVILIYMNIYTHKVYAIGPYFSPKNSPSYVKKLMAITDMSSK